MMATLLKKHNAEWKALRLSRLVSFWMILQCTLMVVMSIPTTGSSGGGRSNNNNNIDNNSKSNNDMIFDVLVYGSTPSGVLAAVAASRHLRNTSSSLSPPAAARVALLSQRTHIGGMCSGGLGETDVGSCADQVIGGITLEFFRRNQQSYPHYGEPNRTDPQAHIKKWNLEPHVAERVFRQMLDEAGVVLLPYGQIVAVTMKKSNGTGSSRDTTTIIEKIHVGYTHRYDTTYAAKIFIDASYEGDLMARVPGLTYTVGRESQQHYNESGAGSGGPGRRIAFGMEYINPFWDDDDSEQVKEGKTYGSVHRFLRNSMTVNNSTQHGKEQQQKSLPSKRRLLPLLQSAMPKPRGEADKEVQAYNFRICVTNDTSLRVPFTEPDSYASHGGARWELLRRFGGHGTTRPVPSNRHKRQSHPLFWVESHPRTITMEHGTVTTTTLSRYKV